MKLKLLNLIILFFLLAITYENSYCQTQEPRDFGYKSVSAKGYGRTHKLSLNDAFKNAIENAVGIYIQSETEVRNYQLKKDRILSYAEGYIHRYKIINKYIDTNNDVVIEIDAIVSNQRLYDDLVLLQILQMMVGNPTILVFFESFKEQNPRYIKHAIYSINEYLLQYNYNIIDLDQAEKLIETDARLLASQNINFDLATHFKANIYLTVDIISENTRYIGTRQYVKAKLNLKAYESTTAKILGVSTAYSPEISFDRMETAIEACIDDSVDFCQYST